MGTSTYRSAVSMPGMGGMYGLLKPVAAITRLAR